MHILITGGTGFFGKALLNYWLANPVPQISGAKLTFISRDPARFMTDCGHLLKPLSARVLAADVQLPESLPESNYSHVLHAATDSTRGLSLSPLQRYDQIVIGTRNILDLAVRCGAKRLLLTSSGGVYGAQPPTLAALPESYHGMPDPLNPENAYSVGKRAAEHLAALYENQYGISTVIARCFAFVGPDLPLDGNFAIGNFIRDALSGSEIIVKGDGTPQRTYMHQDDLARWLTTMLIEDTPSRVYNVGSAEPITVGDLAHVVAKIAANDSKVRILKTPPTGPSAERVRYIPDVDRAATELNLRTNYDLQSALTDTLKKLRQ